jgi:C4-type Zn-finger protein
MACDTGYVIEAACPVCGTKLDVSVFLHSVQMFSNTVQVTLGSHSVTHRCDFGPNTDGKRPIERFIKHGALDDQGKRR